MSITEAERSEIHRAVTAIAARCDGAESLDGMGFNGHDTDFGRLVAGLPVEALTDDVVAGAHAMLRTYRKQLAECGIDYDKLPSPNGVKAARASKKSVRSVVADGQSAKVVFGYDEVLVGEVHRLPGARWNRDGKHWDVPVSPELKDFATRFDFGGADRLPATPPPATAPSGPRGRVSVQGSKIAVRFNDYYPALVKRMKQLPHWKWNGETKSWEFPKDVVRSVRRVAVEEGLEMSQGFVELAAAPDVTVRIEGMRMVVKARFDSRLSNRMGQLGATWRGDWRAWVLPIEKVQEVIKALDELGMDHDLDVGRALDYVNGLNANLVASRAEDAELDPISGFAMTLFPFQRGGVKYALENGRCFIADQVGLGKTIQALAAAQARGAFPLLIVCPASLKLNWLREARRALPGRNAMMISGERPRPFGLLRPDIVIVNYDILAYWVETLKEDLRPVGLVLDESHSVKELSAQRTQAAIEIGHAVIAEADDPTVLLLSGTPVLNRRGEYASQLEVMGRLEEFGGRKAVENDPDISEHLRSAGAMVRRLKKDVQDELPPVMWQYLPLEPDPKVMIAYRAAEEDLLKYLAEKAYAIAEEQGTDPKAAAVTARMRASSAEHLVRIGVLRQLAARAKLPAAKRWVSDELDRGEAILLFGCHNAVLDSVEDSFRCDSIRGGQSQVERQTIVDRFQEGKDNLLALNMDAGGVGLTLTAAESVVFVELGWTPAIHDQAVGRCWGRLNDPHGARATMLYVEGTIDEWMAALLEEKREEVDNATDGTEASELAGESIAGRLLEDLTDLALSGGSVAQAAKNAWKR